MSTASDNSTYIVPRTNREDAYLVTEVDPAQITYRDPKDSESGGQLSFAQYKGGRLFVELGPVNAEYGLSKWDPSKEADEKKKKANKKDTPDYSITCLVGNNEQLQMFNKWDEANIEYAAKNSKQLFGAERSIEMIRQLYVPIVRRKNKKGEIPAEIKFKAGCNKTTKKAALEILNENEEYTYRHYEDDKLNDEDEKLRKELKFPEYDDSCAQIQRGDEVFMKIQYTGLYFGNGGVFGTTFKIQHVLKKQAKQKTTSVFRNKFKSQAAPQDGNDSNHHTSPAELTKDHQKNDDETLAADVAGGV